MTEKSSDLASEFGVPEEWVKRSLKACENAGKNEQYFIDRYLLKLEVKLDAEIGEESRKIQKEECR